MFILPHNEISIYSFMLDGKAVLVVVVEKLKPMAENIETTRTHINSDSYMLYYGKYVFYSFSRHRYHQLEIVKLCKCKIPPEKLLKQHMGGNENKEDTRICVQTYII